MSVEPKGEIESPSSASMDGQGRSEGAFTSKKLSHERLKLNVCIDALAFLAFAISESSWVALINTPTADYYSESDLFEQRDPPGPDSLQVGAPSQSYQPSP
jgi:hypothetical protein